MMSRRNDDAPAVQRASKIGELPPVVRYEGMIARLETVPARDPEGGRDTDRDFMIRYCG
jgi:hypothetical protein